ncbi:EboA domain-containing protein [Rubrolithibacter danxiaensis]|uniref:EboA domain-containing protein n=1 Tax=Rubrolithibacter danxiaensis TaxID=3390805 RepID=UPI003BF90A8F
MYEYDLKKLLSLFAEILKQNLKPQGFQWLNDKTVLFKDGSKSSFFTAFTAAPRFVGKSLLTVSAEQQIQAQQIRKDFNLHGFTADQLSRIWFLLHFPTENKSNYTETINSLFQAAEMNELVALYSALPLLAYPEEWTFRCTEGIRSNIGSVLESVICNNPYPAENLDESAWNQLVLKAFFTDKPVNKIIGLDKRANQKLADTLSDYAHERWAAHRTINPQLWRLVGPFLNENLFEDIQKLFKEGDETEKKAAALACSSSRFAPARQLLEQYPDLKAAVEKNELTWNVVAQAAIA